MNLNNIFPTPVAWFNNDSGINNGKYAFFVPSFLNFLSNTACMFSQIENPYSLKIMNPFTNTHVKWIM